MIKFPKIIITSIKILLEIITNVPEFEILFRKNLEQKDKKNMNEK